MLLKAGANPFASLPHTRLVLMHLGIGIMPGPRCLNAMTPFVPSTRISLCSMAPEGDVVNKSDCHCCYFLQCRISSMLCSPSFLPAS